ncbi:MAG TPA: molybdopterin-dependent oxidoreductase [Burkholderiaceae bacterium]|nr:molybdopterin-dependent oxidoreductase [Burkholderiaceae bacterium]
MKKVHALLFAAVTVLTAAQPATCFGQSDATILKVSGRIGRTNSPDGKSYTFSIAELQKLGDVTIKATTRYTRTADFTGPRLRDILQVVQAAPDATGIDVVALDGYQQTVPITDLKKWDVILAHTQGGKRLTVATLGPLWIMYPIDNYPAELNNNEITSKLVWSLTGIVVK